MAGDESRHGKVGMSENEKRELKSYMASVGFWFVGERKDGSVLFIRGFSGRATSFTDWEAVKGVCR